VVSPAIMARPIIAYLACPWTQPGSPTRDADAFGHDLMMGVLGYGLFKLGYGLQSVSWDDASTDWSQYPAAVLGSTWDYATRFQAFTAQLRHIASKTRLLNPLATVEWNAQKTYLRDLEQAGCAIIPTLWLDAAEENRCREAFEAFQVDTLIIKPQVGANAWRQVKLAQRDPWPAADTLPPGPCMVQPYLQAIETEGEYSFLFFGREFSHAVVKRAKKGDYRIQATYGGVDSPYAPTAKEIALAAQALKQIPGDLLYARVDMVRGNSGALAVIELELIEPFLYPLYAPQTGDNYARALHSLLQRA
jgi:hypothetical protein